MPTTSSDSSESESIAPPERGATWRQCPTCLAWRDDVRRDHTGAREPCGACDPHEFGRCDCCGYKPRALKVPQEGGHDALSAFRARMWAERPWTPERA